MRIKKMKVLALSSVAVFGLYLGLGISPTVEAATWKKLIDYGQTGYSETSRNWTTYNSPESVNGSYRYLSREVGNHTRTGTATWKTTVPYCGTYKVRVSCRKTENRTPDADYYVTKNELGEEAHFSFNQLNHHNVLDWDTFGVFYYVKDQVVRVFLDGEDDGWSDCADAVEWELVEELRCPLDAPVTAAPNSLLLN